MSPPLPIGPMALKAAPRVTVARPVLGLTLYLAEPAVWAAEGTAALLQAFRSRIPAQSLRWYTTSRLTDWHLLDEKGLEEIDRAVSYWLLAGRPRHLFQLRLVDDTGAAGFGFAYREIDPRLAARAATIELSVPSDQDPELLVEIAGQTADKWPLLSAIGGYSVSWNPFEKPTAFWQAYEWCRRYVGLDVQDPDAMAWHAVSTLPGTNWLTLIGDPLADRLRLDLDALAAGPWHNGVAASRFRRGLLLQAGPAPTLGDVNQLDFPWAYADVSRALESHLPGAPTELWGGFHQEKATGMWMRRFVDPEKWQ